MAFFYVRNRLINLDKVIQFFIEQNRDIGKFRIFCELENMEIGPFLYEYNNHEDAIKMLMEINEELNSMENN